MTLPYATIVSVIGIAGTVMGKGLMSIALLLAGIASCLSSALSLKAWRSGKSNTRYTLTSAGRELSTSRKRETKWF